MAAPRIEYNIRFTTQIKCSKPDPTSLSTAAAGAEQTISAVHQPKNGRGERLDKSRRGCKECKSRKIKCDDMYPVCL